MLESIITKKILNLNALQDYIL